MAGAPSSIRRWHLQELARANELARSEETGRRAEIDACLEKVKELRQKSIDDATAAIAANRHLARAYLTRGMAYDNQQLRKRPSPISTRRSARIPRWSGPITIAASSSPRTGSIGRGHQGLRGGGQVAAQRRRCPISNLYLIYRREGRSDHDAQVPQGWQEKSAAARDRPGGVSSIPSRNHRKPKDGPRDLSRTPN